MAIQELRDISERIKTGAPLSDGQRIWLGRAFEDFLARRSRSIEEAMGLSFPKGGLPWWREEANRKRDAALKALADRHFAHMTVAAQARTIRALTVRYAASAWRLDRTVTAMPRHYAGGAHEWLYCAFASGAPLPVSERSLRHILGRSLKSPGPCNTARVGNTVSGFSTPRL
jgi:hypothetical protein